MKKVKRDRMIEVYGGLHIFAKRWNEGYQLYAVTNILNNTVIIPVSVCRVSNNEITHIKESYLHIMQGLYPMKYMAY